VPTNVTRIELESIKKIFLHTTKPISSKAPDKENTEGRTMVEAERMWSANSCEKEGLNSGT